MKIRRIEKHEMPELFELYSHYSDNPKNLIPISNTQYEKIWDLMNFKERDLLNSSLMIYEMYNKHRNL